MWPFKNRTVVQSPLFSFRDEGKRVDGQIVNYPLHVLSIGEKVVNYLSHHLFLDFLFLSGYLWVFLPLSWLVISLSGRYAFSHVICYSLRGYHSLDNCPLSWSPYLNKGVW